MKLLDIKQFLDKIIDSSAAVLGLELTIINADPIVRISATGVFANSFDRKDWSNTYTLETIKSKKPMVVIDTSNYTKISAELINKYYSIILYPIVIDDNIEGVIVLGSFNEKQNQLLLDKEDEYFDYIENISLLISAKLEKVKLLKESLEINTQMSCIMESVGDGLLMYSLEEGVLQINGNAKQLLCKNNPKIYNEFLKKISIIGEKVIFNKTDLKKEIYVTANNKTYAVIIKAKYIKNSFNSNVIFIINKFEDIQSAITQDDIKYDVDRDDIISNCCEILNLKKKIKDIKDFDSSVLILGESGTGKELFARYVHYNSNRRDKPLISINCAAIPETLLESELFGYEGGAFTGAKKSGRMGKFLLADKGTLFLDEIGDMPLYLQAKLLRVLSEQKIDRLGSERPIDVDVRIVAATNKDINNMIINKEFREDLYYRLNVIPLVIPPLRERKEDVRLLSKTFLSRFNKKLSKNIKGFSDEVENILLKYNWPGNVRELLNCIEYMVSFEKEDYIKIDNIPNKIIEEVTKEGLDIVHRGTLKELVSIKEKEIIDEMIRSYNNNLTVGNIRQICKKLDISIATFYRKINIKNIN